MLVPFNERLSEIMTENEITANTLGKKIGLSGSIISRWLRRNSSIMSTNLIKLAEYFDCSLNYICGRTDDAGKYNSQTYSSFAQRLKLLIQESEKSILMISKETKLPRSRFYDWFENTPPKSMSLIILAEYFDCSIDYLVGHER